MCNDAYRNRERATARWLRSWVFGDNPLTLPKNGSNMTPSTHQTELKMANLKATSKAGVTVEIKNSKKAYTHAWFVTINNGTKVIKHGYTEKGDAQANRDGQKYANWCADGYGYHDENGKFVTFKSRGIQFEIAEVTEV